MRFIHNVDNIWGVNFFVVGDQLLEWEWNTEHEWVRGGFSYFRIMVYESEGDFSGIFTRLDYDDLGVYPIKQSQTCMIFIRDNIKDIMQTLRNIISEDIQLLMADSLLRNPTLGTNFYRDLIG